MEIKMNIKSNALLFLSLLVNIFINDAFSSFKIEGLHECVFSTKIFKKSNVQSENVENFFRN